MVVAADTQESFGSEKAYVSKLYPISGPHWKAILAGAGHSHFIDYVKEKIGREIAATSATPQEFEENLKALMNSLYDGEFRRYPTEETNKDLQLLVALQLRKEFPVLFSCDSTLVRRVYDARVIGVETLASRAREFHSMKLNNSQTAYACMYIVKEAKERYEGVGGTTHILSLGGDGEFGMERSWDIPERERALTRITYIANRMLIGMIPATHPRMFEATLRNAIDVIRQTRKELEEIDRKFERALKISQKLNRRVTERIQKAAQKIEAKE